MAKTYSTIFGTGDPRTFTGLSPTFLVFTRLTDGATLAPPAVSEALTGSGIYKFTYGVTQPIAFLLDAATTSPGAQGRYVPGQIDPSDRIDEVGTTLIALGTTNLNGFVILGLSLLAISATLSTISTSIGSTASSVGSTSVDPGTLYGFLMRAQEMAEGNQFYTKSSGLLDFWTRGTSTLLREKTIADNTTQTTKT